MVLEQLSDKLNIEHDMPSKEVVPVEKEENLPAPIMDMTDADEDYETTRQMFLDLSTTAKEAVDALNEIAASTDHPRAYEVLGQLIRTAGESTRNLYELHKKRADLIRTTTEDKTKITGSPINVDKAVFVGTPAEVLANLKRLREEANEQQS